MKRWYICLIENAICSNVPQKGSSSPAPNNAILSSWSQPSGSKKKNLASHGGPASELCTRPSGNPSSPNIVCLRAKAVISRAVISLVLPFSRFAKKEQPEAAAHRK
ncbi:hypothetical protein LIA77_03324 [Sarocladium implicatum]|nr:hypothetical protein LIA77_03324 [Sarocladium implicatum]